MLTPANLDNELLTENSTTTTTTINKDVSVNDFFFDDYSVTCVNDKVLYYNEDISPLVAYATSSIITCNTTNNASISNASFATLEVYEADPRSFLKKRHLQLFALPTVDTIRDICSR